MSTKISVVYYSSTGSVHALAEAVADGARAAGAEVRLRRAPELAPPEAVAENPQWQRHAEQERDRVDEVTLDDLEWADGYAFGTPTRFGAPSAQLKQFMDSAGGLWQAGALAGKAATGFTSALNVHGGQESTVLAMNNIFAHWGCVIVPVGYTDEAVFAAGGNPYGTSHTAGPDNDEPGAETLDAARYQGRRVAEVAAVLVPLRDTSQASAA